MRPLGSLLALTVLTACGSSSAPERGAPERSEADTPRSPGAAGLDPACADPMADVRSMLALPAGVTADPRGQPEVQEAASSWHLPPGVTFTLSEPRLRGDRLELRGELVNTTDTPQTVMLSEAGAGYFSATLADPSLVRRTFVATPEPGVTPPPALFPEPHAYTLAPGARWPHATTVIVSCWEPAPGRTVTAHWWLNVEGEGLDGEVRVPL